MTAVGTRSAAGGAASLLRVLPLAGASFAAGTGDMVIAGILPALAAGLRVSETAAGQLVTAYAVAYGCGTVLVAALTGGMPRRRVVTWGLAAFTVVNAAAAVVSSFGVLLVLRVLAGLAAAACTPAAVAIAAEVAPEERRGRYLALVTGGLTVALVAGVPAGTWLGGEYGWRSTMVFVALLGAVSLAGAAGVPFMPAPPSLGLRRRLAPLAVPAVARLLAATVVSGIGGMMMLTYLFPVLREAGGVGHQQMTALFTLYGVAGTAAAWLGGRGADRWGPYRTLVAALAGYGVTLWAAAALTMAGGVPSAVLGVVVVLLALAAWAINPPLQSMMYGFARGAAAEAMALATAALFTGASLGGAMGGILLDGWGPAAIPLAGGVLLLAAVPLIPRRASS